MKRLLWILLLPLPLFSQSTTVSTTGVVDTDGFTWSGATYNIQFYPNPSWPSIGSYTWTGGSLQGNTQFTGVLNGSGAFSQSIPSSTSITPSGSQWTFTICPNASGGCFSTNSPVTGATQNITSLLNAFAKGPRFAANPTAFGYGPVEVSPTPQPGSWFFNTTIVACQQWNGSGWQSCYSGVTGGTISPGTVGCVPTYSTTTNLAGCSGISELITTPQTMTGPLVIGTTEFLDSSLYGSFSAACSAAVSGNLTLLVSKAWTALPTQTCAANLSFAFGLGSLQPASGQTVTLTGTITAPIVKIFDTSLGTISLGTQTSAPPVEWFGAVGDATGSAGVGTVNNTFIQACLNALSNGQCMLLNRMYRITSPISITTSNVGIGGVSYQIANTSLYPTPLASTIVIDSASADAIDAAGASTSANIAYNRFTNFTIARTTIPTGTPAGLSLQFSYGAIIDGVTSLDSAEGFYFHGVASQGTGYIQNCAAEWGYNGVGEIASGTLAGFEIDSVDGTPNNSFRIRNSFAASNFAHSGSVTSIAFEVSGHQMHDFHSFHLEAAQTDYGIAVLGTGGIGSENDTDIFLTEPVLDQIWVSAIKTQNFTTGNVQINGGWFTRNSGTASTAAVVDLEASNHVSLVGGQFWVNAGPPSSPDVLINGGGSNKIVANDFGVNVGSAISCTSSGGNVYSSNIATGITATNAISLATCTDTVVADNVLDGSGTNGISIDSASTGTTGIETNKVGPGFTNQWSDASNNAAMKLDGSGHLYVSSLAGGGTTCLEALNTGQIQASGIACGSGSGVANVNVTIPILTAIPANTCWGSTGSNTPATFTMTGVTTSMGITPRDTANPSAIAGWGANGGLVLHVWPSASNQGSYLICNISGSTITSGSYPVIMGAQ